MAATTVLPTPVPIPVTNIRILLLAPSQKGLYYTIDTNGQKETNATIRSAEKAKDQNLLNRSLVTKMLALQNA